MDANKTVFVVGAGVIGLTTAIRALEAGYAVYLFAEVFPAIDPRSIKAASFWAGANHISFADPGSLMEEMEKETLEVFLDLIKQDPHVPVMTRPHYRFLETADHPALSRSDHIARFYANYGYRVLESSEVLPGMAVGETNTTICIDVPRYLPYLMERFYALGGKAFRTTLTSLSSLLTTPPTANLEPLNEAALPATPPAALINCTALGAATLTDVLDTAVYPIRGEVLIVRAPWVVPSITFHFASGDVSYIIPRQSGDVIVGGTFQIGDTHPTSRPETVAAIKARIVRVFPDILPAEKRERRDVRDLDVVLECVGLRPARTGTARLETSVLDVDGTKIPVVHNYGHGGGGYQSSWGSARRALELLAEALA
ncbi:D-amino-acid oxidase [Mycena kentingensis (nom. inval.)]|nr:D-amino-acid oxidase [Mycena kentingensis (nom. inval.)]